jgi:hypothetical protein
VPDGWRRRTGADRAGVPNSSADERTVDDTYEPKSTDSPCSVPDDGRGSDEAGGCEVVEALVSA